jgi:hypothetical protein
MKRTGKLKGRMNRRLQDQTGIPHPCQSPGNKREGEPDFPAFRHHTISA